MDRYLKRYLLPAILFYSALFIIYFLFIHNLSFEFNKLFLNWDAQHYYFIKENGYDLTRSAFFPFFPFLWKYSTLSPIGISLLNGFVFILSIAFLLYIYEVSLLNSILIFSIPSFIFFFYPYTESFFFLASTFLLYGLKRKYEVVIYLSLFFLSLVRPTISVILPGIILVFLLDRDEIHKNVKKLFFAAASITFGLLITFGLHKYYTGNWNSFFISQKKWGNLLQIPSFPLRSWGGDIINRLDGVALFISIVSIILIIRKLYLFVLKIENGNKELFISLLYVAGSGLLVLMYRNGELFSLNRFVFCSPFFLVLAIYFLKNSNEVKWKIILYCFLILSIYWLLFASFVHIQTFIKYELLSAFLVLTFLLSYKNKFYKYSSAITLVAVNTAFFLYFFYRMLTNDWVG